MKTHKLNRPVGGVAGNEQGVTIITVLFLLLLLSIMGVTATRTVIKEKKIVRSEAVFEKCFYYAESSSLEAVQKIENATEYDELLPTLTDDDSENRDLLYSADEDDPYNDDLNLDLNDDGSFDQDDLSVADGADTDKDSRRVAVLMPIEDSSLSLDSTRLYTYMMYGTSNANGGSSKVKIGYKKRF